MGLYNLFTEEELSYLRQYYHTHGAAFCGRHLGRADTSVRKKAHEMGIRWCGVRRPETYNVNPEHFRNVTLPEVAYFLGYFWADGYIHRCSSTKSRALHRVSIPLKIDDAEWLLSIAKRFGKWSTFVRQPPKDHPTWHATMDIITSNGPLYRFLFEHGYDTKSEGSPDKIVAHLPESLRPAFWLGYFDGDGHVRLRDKTSGVLQFAGSFETDWSGLSRLLDDLGVRYWTGRYTSPKGHRSSTLNITNRRGVEAFYRYIEPFSILGLPRKQAVFKEMLSRPFSRAK